LTPSYRVELAPRARRDLRRLDRPVRERIISSLDRFALEGVGDAVPLKGQPGRYRPRIGDWRAAFTRDREARTLTVLWVRGRESAYRD
jgi:mRNA interferase RelE/StbE